MSKKQNKRSTKKWSDILYKRSKNALFGEMTLYHEVHEGRNLVRPSNLSVWRSGWSVGDTQKIFDN